jgi:DNA-binding transcriptional MocR family regulator
MYTDARWTLVLRSLPAPFFSTRQQFKNYLRLNTGHPWTNAMEQATQKLGNLLRCY